MKIRILKECLDKDKIVDAAIKFDSSSACAIYFDAFGVAAWLFNYDYNDNKEFETIEEKSEREQIIEEIKKIQAHHFDTTDCVKNNYFIGMFNGIDYVLATLEKRDTDYLNTYKLDLEAESPQQEPKPIYGKTELMQSLYGLSEFVSEIKFK